MSNTATAQLPAVDEAQAPLVVSQNGSALTLESAQLEGRGPWKVREIDQSRLMLVEDDADTGVAAPAGMASMPVEAFKDFLMGLARSRWSGMLAIDTGAGIKRLYFNAGAVAFAASNVMDDRLGEVIYREDRISLDELTNSAAMVTKSRKFGQVLLTNGIFTHAQLWDALKLQVKQILRSLFMSDRVYCELVAGGGQAPTELTFLEGTEELLTECSSYGAAYRAFLSQLSSDTEVVLLVPAEKIPAQFPPGSFTGDLLALIGEKNKVESLLTASKLIDHYTVAALLDLVHAGLCALRFEGELDRSMSSMLGAHLAPLKSRIDAYGYVLAAVRKAFAEVRREMPVAEMQAFAQALCPDGFSAVFLDSRGELPRACIAGLFSQGGANSLRVDYFTIRLDALIQFLLQLAGDTLDFQVARRIRQDYRAVAG